MKGTLAAWPEAEVSPGLLWNDSAPGPRLPSRLLERWRSELRTWRAPTATRDALERLADPRTRVVVTGQQPGPWGGALYTLYKGATATALAQRLASRGVPAVAVFWVQGDDADWGEVGWGTLPRRDLSLFTHRWDAPVPPRHWVGSGSLSTPPEAQAIFRDWGREGGLLGEPRGGRPEELSRGFIAALLAWFGEGGLVPLDARWPETREGGAELWRAYLDRHGEIAGRVKEAGEAMAAAGKPALLTADTVERGLFILDGECRQETDPSIWEEEVRSRVVGNPIHAGELAPSVLLRALLQDRVLGTAAHVVGGAESLYLEQLAPAYAALGVHPPVRVPRLRAVVAPEGLLPAGDAHAAAADPERWVGEVAGKRLDAGLVAGVQSARDAASRALKSLADPDASGRRDLAEVAESARRKIHREFSRIEDVLARRARQDVYRAEPRMRHLPEFLRPRRGEQERGLSAASAHLVLGERAPARLLEAARAHLDAIGAGKCNRYYLEGEGD